MSGRGTYEGAVVGAGTRIQAGVPSGPAEARRSARGLLLRAVVLKTYVLDSKGHPRMEWATRASGAPTAVYCDVLAMPDQPGQRWVSLHGVLVSQPGPSGIHRGRMWRPRPSSKDLSGPTAELDQTTNPAALDGDHVLVGFLGNDLDQPIILASLPHPLQDNGHSTGPAGQRLRLLEADGDPDLTRHHGVAWGVNNDGDWQVDSSRATRGEIDALGAEPAPPTDGRGAQTHSLPKDAKFKVVLLDMTNPAAPVEKLALSLDSSGLSLQMEGATLASAGKDALATLTVGDGAKNVALANPLEILYNAFKDVFTAHTHVDSIGGTTQPTAAVAPAWDAAIASTKVKVPNG
jgi:hypothetical protein